MATRHSRIATRAGRVGLAAGLLVLAPVWTGASGAPPKGRPPGPLWLAPADPKTPASRHPLAVAVEQLEAGKPALAIPALARGVSDRDLGGYALLYLGRAQLAAGKTSEAAFSARELLSQRPAGYLREAALWLSADAAEAASNWPASADALQRLIAASPLSPETAYLRLGRAALKAGDTAQATASFATVYYDYPLSAEADQAADELARLTGPSTPPLPDARSRDRDRAEALFGAKRYADARKLFASLKARGGEDDFALIDLRLAECDFYSRKFAAAQTGLRAILDAGPGSRRLEAEFYFISALRELGHTDEYVARARAFVAANPSSLLAEDTLNSLGTHFVLANDDGQAARVFAELYERFPTGPHADRAAWRTGWWAYKTRDYATTVRVFDSAAETMRRSDYRPSWLYWSARAHQRLNEGELAARAFDRTIAEYRNTYYGRQAMKERQSLSGAAPGLTPVALTSVQEAAAPPAVALPEGSVAVIRALLSAGLFKDAVLEVRRVEREVGELPVLEATAAYALNRSGQFRDGIVAMRKAYPGYVAAAGQDLPAEILAVIFPAAYWDLVQKYATAHGLDPYLMASLIRQESTFEADAHSAANAWGLMQILPSTGRSYAKTLGLGTFRTSRLTDPATNIRIGMSVFADLLKQFGNVAAALAAYNAGDQRASKWLAERPGFAEDEFIDDIPYPETQVYVRRILGNVDDYRRLYGELKVAPVATAKR